MCAPTKEPVMQLNQHNPCDMAHCPLRLYTLKYGKWFIRIYMCVCVCVCVFNIIDPLKYIIENPPNWLIYGVVHIDTQEGIDILKTS